MREYAVVRLRLSRAGRAPWFLAKIHGSRAGEAPTDPGFALGWERMKVADNPCDIAIS